VTHLSKHDARVETIPLVECQRLCREYHYAKGGSNTATFRHGLLTKDDLIVGCAWWLPPTKAAAIATFPEGDWRRVIALSRVVVVPGMPTNAASFLVGRSMRLVAQSKKWDCLVTYADDMQGHTGAIYRATNWEYIGKTAAGRAYRNADGKLVSRKAGARTRTHAEMLALGCTCVGSFAKHKYRKVLN
jgi:hypothetical protein